VLPTALACAALSAIGQGVATAAASAATPCANADVLVVDEATSELAKRALRCLLNRDRVAHRVRKAKPVAALRRAAQRHGDSMATYHYESHIGRGGTTLRQRARRAGYIRSGQRFVVGETIAWASGVERTANGIFARLMGSPGHKRIVRRARYHDFGVGLALGAPDARANPGLTLVVVFGTRG